MLELKNKIPPSPQILRLKEWFSRYDFEVKHIKGKQNIIPDFLSRPREHSTHQQGIISEKKSSITIFSDHRDYPFIMMNEASSSNQNSHEFPPELTRIQPITPGIIKTFSQTHMFHYLATTIQDHQIKPKPTWFNPFAPYLNIFPILLDKVFTESDMWYLWCVTTLYKYPIILPTIKLIRYLEGHTQNTLICKFLSWFAPISWWKEQAHKEAERLHVWNEDTETAKKFVSLFTIHRPYFKHPNKHLYTHSQALSYATYPSLKEFMQTSKPPFYKEELTLHLHEINGSKITQNSASSSCNMLKEIELICQPQWEVPPDAIREEYKRVHTEEFPPNDTPVYTSNLLWQEWNSPEHSWQDSQDPWSDVNPCYYPGHDSWQDSQDPWPDPSTWSTWPSQQTDEDACKTSQDAWPPWPTPPK